MSEKLIVIVCATGLQGGSVARLFQTLPGWRVRGITRDPTKASCAPLRDAGVELVAADLDDPASLDRAFEGANAIFAKESREPNKVAFDLEVQQGKNNIHAAAKHLHTLDRLVVSTLSDSEKWSKGEIKWNLHFDSKARYCQYLKDTHAELAKKTSYVQIGYYLSNWTSFPFLAPKKEADGSFDLIRLSLLGASVQPLPSTRRTTRATLSKRSSNTNKLMSQEEYAALWGKKPGVKATLRSLGIEDLKAAGLPDFLALEVYEVSTYVSTWGWAGGDPEVKLPAEVGVEMDKFTKVGEWIEREDWSSVL